MNPHLTRIRRADFFAYYRRLLRDAVREATRLWIRLLSASFFVAVLTFCLLLIGGRSGLGSAAWGLVAFGASWLLIVVWFVVTIPPHIERQMQLKEESLRVMSQRRNVANELRNHMTACRVAARKAREDEIDAEGRNARILPDEYHHQVLTAATDAAERLERLGTTTGHPSYQEQIEEINGAVKSQRCANADEAIEQLEALAAVLERQLASGTYW